MNKRNSLPIFILGSERSGSNLLRELLSNHRNLHGPVSPHLLDTFFNSSWLLLYGDLRDKNNMKRLFEAVKQLVNHPYNAWELEVNFEDIYREYRPQSFLDMYDFIYLEIVRKHGKKRFVSKDNHVFNYVFSLLSYYDDPKFLYLYRDPRDYTASWMKNPLFIRTSYDAIKKWVKDQEKCASLIKAHKVNVCYVKYEDLISDTKGVMKRVLDFVGEQVDEACFTTNQERGESLKWNPYWVNLSKPVMSKNKKKYLKQFSHAEIELIESVAAPYMRMLGYKFDTAAGWKYSKLFAIKNRVKRKIVSLTHKKHIKKDMDRLHSKIQLIEEIRQSIMARNGCN